MKKKIRYTFTVFIVMFLLLNNVLFIYLSCASDIVFIGNKDIPENSLSEGDLRSIFLGEKAKWNDQQKVIFVLLMTEAHEEFLKKYIGSTPAQYANYWKKMVFTGKARSPMAFKNTEELISYIAKTSGAIGYIPSESCNDQVKLIPVK